MTTTPSWAIQDNGDGTATLVHEGKEIGTIQYEGGYVSPTVLTFEKDPADRTYADFEQRSYVVRGLRVTADDRGGPVVFGYSIASGMGTDRVVPSGSIVTYDQDRAVERMAEINADRDAAAAAAAAEAGRRGA